MKSEGHGYVRRPSLEQDDVVRPLHALQRGLYELHVVMSRSEKPRRLGPAMPRPQGRPLDKGAFNQGRWNSGRRRNDDDSFTDRGTRTAAIGPPTGSPHRARLRAALLRPSTDSGSSRGSGQGRRLPCRPLMGGVMEVWRRGEWDGQAARSCRRAARRRVVGWGLTAEPEKSCLIRRSGP